MLTQHVLYNMQYHPYLIYSIFHGEGGRDPLHKCIQISHDVKQIERYDRSKQIWSHFESVFKVRNPPQPYTDSVHCNWTDKNN